VVRLLPCFDALIMGHKDKTRFIDPRVLLWQTTECKAFGLLER